MGAIAFDTLQYARKLKKAGVPDSQAEAQAEIMGEAFLLNMDALVTKDYLDAKFAEQDARMEARMDVRFAEVDARFVDMDARMDARFAEMDTRFDRLESRIEAQMDVRFAKVDTRFAEMDGKFRLLTWMLAAVIASTVIPAMHQLLS
jgi:hypothetical protein